MTYYILPVGGGYVFLRTWVARERRRVGSVLLD